MNVNNVCLAAIGTKLHQYPTDGMAEIAFVGKSNVGKSSLINGLINRKAMARTSGQPGKTRTINFYNVEDKVYFVDLPGYGYARASKESINQWGMMIEEYLQERKQLILVAILVDIRHEPSENDKMMVHWIRETGYTPVIIATKADKINRSQLQKHTAMIRKGLGLEKDDIMVAFSATTKQGKDQIWEAFEEMMARYADENMKREAEADTEETEK